MAGRYAQSVEKKSAIGRSAVARLAEKKEAEDSVVREERRDTEP